MNNARRGVGGQGLVGAACVSQQANTTSSGHHARRPIASSNCVTIERWSQASYIMQWSYTLTCTVARPRSVPQGSAALPPPGRPARAPRVLQAGAAARRAHRPGPDSHGPRPRHRPRLQCTCARAPGPVRQDPELLQTASVATDTMLTGAVFTSADEWPARAQALV